MNPDLAWPEIALRLGLAFLAGAIIRFNREEHDRPAGLRTTVLVSLAAAGSFVLANRLPQIGKGGSIINTASIQSFDPSETLIAYAATKAAIASFTKSLSALAIKKGVRVNAVAPGPVWTPLIPATLPKEATQKFGETSAFGRPAQPAEIAPLFVFLASASASFVTGEVYGATGGQMPI